MIQLRLPYGRATLRGGRWSSADAQLSILLNAGFPPEKYPDSPSAVSGFFQANAAVQQLGGTLEVVEVDSDSERVY